MDIVRSAVPSPGKAWKAVRPGAAQAYGAELHRSPWVPNLPQTVRPLAEVLCLCQNPATDFRPTLKHTFTIFIATYQRSTHGDNPMRNWFQILSIASLTCNPRQCSGLIQRVVLATRPGADSSVVERLSYTQLVGGSNPSSPTISFLSIPRAQSSGIPFVFVRRVSPSVFSRTILSLKMLHGRGPSA